MKKVEEVINEIKESPSYLGDFERFYKVGQLRSALRVTCSYPLVKVYYSGGYYTESRPQKNIIACYTGDGILLCFHLLFSMAKNWECIF